MLKINKILFASVFLLLFYIRLNVTFGNEDGNCIDGDNVDGGEFFIDKELLSIRLYGFIFESV